MHREAPSTPKKGKQTVTIEKPNFSLPIMSANFRRFNARYVCYDLGHLPTRLILGQNRSCLRLPEQSQSPTILEGTNAYYVSTGSLYILLPQPKPDYHHSACDMPLRHHGTCLCH